MQILFPSIWRVHRHNKYPAITARMAFSDFTLWKKICWKFWPWKREYEAKIYLTSLNRMWQKLTWHIKRFLPLLRMEHLQWICCLVKEKKELFPNSVSNHCILHQEVLCAKVLPFGHIMSAVKLIVNCICASLLQHQCFKCLLEDAEDKPTDLILHMEMRWLSRGWILSRFWALIEEIKEFSNSNSKNPTLAKTIDKLNDPSWLLDLAFLTDVS